MPTAQAADCIALADLSCPFYKVDRPMPTRPGHVPGWQGLYPGCAPAELFSKIMGNAEKCPSTFSCMLATQSLHQIYFCLPEAYNGHQAPSRPEMGSSPHSTPAASRSRRLRRLDLWAPLCWQLIGCAAALAPTNECIVGETKATFL